MVLRDREVFVATFSDGKRETEGSSPFVVIAHGCSIMSGSPRASARVGEPATFYRVATTAYRHCYLYPPPPPPFSVSYSTYVPRFIHALASLTCPRGSWVAVLSLSLSFSLSLATVQLCATLFHIPSCPACKQGRGQSLSASFVCDSSCFPCVLLWCVVWEF